MGGLYNRVKTWVTLEDVTAADINAEFDNVLTNFVPLMIDDYSANATQMRVTADPGEAGTESLATTLAGELARLRHLILEITGKTYWYETPGASITGLVSALGSTLVNNRLSSGRVKSTSEMPTFLVPNGAARTVTVKGATTPFIYYISGTAYTISTDVDLTSLTLAPSSNNTCLVNDTVAADQDWTKYSGENGSEITIDTVGSEISALVGKIAAFSLNNGSTTEMFLAEVGTNKLIKARRGYFFNSSDVPQSRIVYSNNDTITLLKLSWIFAKTDGTLAVTYTNPTWSKAEPSSPAANDYWYDLDNDSWKRHDGSAFVAANAILIGQCVQDTTNTIGARSFEFSLGYDELNTMEIIADTNSQVRTNWPNSQINAWGTIYRNERGNFSWDMATNLASGVTEGASTYYFFYITEDGAVTISDVRPYDRREDLKGYYHPSESWRCVGWAFNNGSSNLEAVESFFNREVSLPILPSQTAARNIEIVDRIIPISSSGGALTEWLPPAAYWRGQELVLIKTSSDLNVITVDGFGSETIDGETTTTLNTQYEKIRLLSDGTNIHVMDRRYPTKWVDGGVTTLTAVTSAPTKGTMSLDKIWYRRVGDGYECEYQFWQSNTAGAANGSGDYLLAIPNAASLTINTTVKPAFAGVFSTGAALDAMSGYLGEGAAAGGGGGRGAAKAFVYDGTTFRIVIETVATAYEPWDSAYYNLAANTVAVGLKLFIPITGWKG